MFQHAHVRLDVSDLARSIAFYTGTLGLALERRGAGEWAEIRAPGLTLRLQARAGRATPGDGVTVGLQVERLDLALAALRAQGLVVTPDRGAGGLRAAQFTDPDGNRLEIFEHGPDMAGLPVRSGG